MSAHTPSWRYTRINGTQQGFTVVGPEGGYIATVDQKKHAILIAAAPDLLAALNLLLERYVGLVECGDCGNWDAEGENQVIAARAAIAKASGNAS